MSASSEEKETLRTEAFSDGVFAIAITLLVLDIQVPELEALAEKDGLERVLLAQWPVYLAFMISFVNLLIIWVCHHNIFSLIRKTDGKFLYINGFLLLTVTVFPFTAALLGEYIATEYASLVAAIFAATIFFNCLSFNLLWNYVASRRHLLIRDIAPEVVREIRNNGFLGLPFYVVALVVAFWSPALSLAICTAMAVFFGVKGTMQHRAPVTRKATTS